MKRADLTVGGTYAHRRGTYGDYRKAEVLTTEPLIETTSPSYSYRQPPLEPVTLPDGSVVQAAARKPYAHTSAASKGVLVRLQVAATTYSQATEELRVVRLMDLHGEYEAVTQAERDRKDREAQRRTDIDERRQAAGVDLLDLIERLEGVLPEATLCQEGNHYNDGLPSKLVIIDRESLRSLLDMVENELH